MFAKRKIKSWKKTAAVLFIVVCTINYITISMNTNNVIKKSLTDSWNDTQTPRPLFQRRHVTVEYDKTNRYVILRNVFLSDYKPDRKDITLLTQCDSGKLRYVLDLADAWEGPIHASLYLVTEKIRSKFLDLIDELRLCHENVRKYVTWHLAYPLSDSTRIEAVNVQQTPIISSQMKTFEVTVRQDVQGYIDFHPNCSNKLLQKIEDFKQEAIASDPDPRNKKGQYIAYFPMNVLANVAVTESNTEFIFFIDADLVPSADLRRNFVEFAKKKNLFDGSYPPGAESTHPISLRGLIKPLNGKSKNNLNTTQPMCPFHKSGTPFPGDIYVTPSFQYKGPNKEIPRTLHELQNAAKREVVAKYYDGIFFHPYGPTFHRYWLSMTRAAEMDCAYSIKYSMNYEPYHISRRSVPMYDERFSGHGNVKVSHVAELAAAGYSFKILNNAFLVHRGWKPHKEKEREQKKREYISQLSLWADFQNEIQKKYFNKKVIQNTFLTNVSHPK